MTKQLAFKTMREFHKGYPYTYAFMLLLIEQLDTVYLGDTTKEKLREVESELSKLSFADVTKLTMTRHKPPFKGVIMEFLQRIGMVGVKGYDD